MSNSARKALILSLARSGVPYSKIGEQVGLSRQHVRVIAAMNGIERAPEKGWWLITDPDEREERRLEAVKIKVARLRAQADEIEAQR